MSVYEQDFLTPPQESEEIYPYGQVWQNASIEGAILLVVVVGIYALSGILVVQLPQNIQQYLNTLLCLTPLGLWLMFSWRTEQAALEPRQKILSVTIITALAANAIGIPLVENFLQVDTWLPRTTAINRIVGYALTVGIVQEMIKYFVVRYTVWPTHFRIRLDGTAYAISAAVGYTTVQNLHLLSASPSILPDALAIRVLANYSVQVSASIIVGYGLAEVWFGKPGYMMLTGVIAVGTFLSGLAIPVRTGLVSAAFFLGVSAPRPLLGLGFAIIVYVIALLVTGFLINSAERNAKEAIRDVGEQ
jgi:RsiW-degrading membrane proteinase PrsW (M82 family)